MLSGALLSADSHAILDWSLNSFHLTVWLEPMPTPLEGRSAMNVIQAWCRGTVRGIAHFALQENTVPMPPRALIASPENSLTRLDKHRVLIARQEKRQWLRSRIALCAWLASILQTLRAAFARLAVSQLTQALGRYCVTNVGVDTDLLEITSRG